MEVMRILKYKSDITTMDTSHWTTGNGASIAYQGVIESGSFADIYQVTLPLVPKT